MTNAQDWLEEQFPDKWERWRIKEIHIKEQLEGEIDVSDFVHWLLKIYFYPNIDHSKYLMIGDGILNRVRIIKLFDAQDWLEENYPKNGVCLINDYCCNKGKKREEITNLKLINLNLTENLDISDFVNLEEELDFARNRLIEIILLKNNRFKSIITNDNSLVKFNYNYLNSETLVKLNLSNNNLEATEISVFSNLINLEVLLIGSENKFQKIAYNKFYGSLESFKNLTKLENLNIENTDINQGIEYLPTSLKKFYFQGTNLAMHLDLYSNNLLTWQVAHPISMQASGQEIVEIDYSNSQLITTITKPEFLDEKKYKYIKLKTNDQLTNLDYSEFFLRDSRPFNWEKNNLENSINNKILPFRLYNLENNLVENAANHKIDNYLTLSYCWGIDWENNPQSYGQEYQTDLTKLGRKAFNKVKAVFKKYNKVKHIWVDNFCINQTDPEEKGNEVKRQKQYYSNATATLIAIDAEIGNQVDRNDEVALAKHLLSLITNSDWFTRAWTFQEGILSKQTIFMFDDYLVDGRLLAQYWGGMQYNHDNGPTYIEMEENNPIIHITPLGWSYGSKSNQELNLRIGEALLAVKNRSQTVPIDGIYAILGLLPYGEQVETSYKDKLCQQCKAVEQQFKQTATCHHSVQLKVEVASYFQADLEAALQVVIKVAFQNGYQIDLLNWLGPRSSSLMPSINENGTTNIKELVNYSRFEKIKKSIIKITENIIHLKGAELLVVKSVQEKETNFEKNFLINLKWGFIDFPITCSDNLNNLKIEAGDVIVLFSLKIALLIPTKPQRLLYLFEFNHNSDFTSFGSDYEILINLNERTIERSRSNFIERVETSDYLRGFDNMNHLYLSIDVNYSTVVKIKLTVESHDQGWADNKNVSYSWGEIGILNSENVEKAERKIIFSNQPANPNWQTHDISITDRDFIRHISQGDKIGIWLRSEYPGWKNYAQKGMIELNYIGKVFAKFSSWVALLGCDQMELPLNEIIEEKWILR